VVLAGNGGVTAAKQLGWKRIAVSRIPLTGAAARKYAIADNRTAELAEWDWEELAVQLDEQVEVFGAEALEQHGWSADDLAGMNLDARQNALNDAQRFADKGSASVVLPMLPPGLVPPVGAESQDGNTAQHQETPDTVLPPTTTTKVVPLFLTGQEAEELSRLAHSVKAHYDVPHLSGLVLLLIRKAAEEYGCG